MAALAGQRERDDDDVRDPWGDLLVAPGADVGLARRGRLDPTDLGGRAGQGVELEAGSSHGLGGRLPALPPARSAALAARLRTLAG